MKLYAYLAIALAIIGGLWYVHHLKALADRIPALEKAVKDEKQKALDQALVFAKATETNREIAASLGALRESQDAFSADFRQRLGSLKITREVVREVSGQQVTCTERDPKLYRQLFNQAVTGTANP